MCSLRVRTTLIEKINWMTDGFRLVQDAMMEEASAPSVKAIHAPADFVPKARRQRNLRNRT